VKTIMTFEQFQQSRKRATPAEISETYGEGVTGFAYGDGLNHIADIEHKSGKYWLIIANIETVSNDLIQLERLLYLWHYIPNAIDGRLSEDDDAFHSYIREYCAYRGKECDGGIMSIMFTDSRRDSYSPSEMRDIMDESFRIYG
jgi:hypothetical protein